MLEGIRICRKGFPNRLQYPEFKQRYQILAAKKVAKIVDSKKATETIVTTIELDLNLYRIGHTKVLVLNFTIFCQFSNKNMLFISCQNLKT